MLCFSCYTSPCRNPLNDQNISRSAIQPQSVQMLVPSALFPCFQRFDHTSTPAEQDMIHYNTIHQGMDPGRGGEFFSKTTHFYTRTSRSSVKLCISERRLDEINHTHLVCILGSGGPLTFVLLAFLPACAGAGLYCAREVGSKDYRNGPLTPRRVHFSSFFAS